MPAIHPTSPVEPVLRSWLIELFDVYAEATGRSKATIGVKVCGGDARFYSALIEGEKTFSTYSFDRSVVGFSENWPSDVPWPAGIPRFGAAQLREKSRAPRAAA